MHIYMYVYTCVYINICIDIRSLCVYIYIYIHSCEFACLLQFKKGNTNQGLQAGSHPVCRLLPERVGTAGIAAHGRAVPLEHPPAMEEWDPWTGIDQENSMAKYLILSARRVTKKRRMFFLFPPFQKRWGTWCLASFSVAQLNLRTPSGPWRPWQLWVTLSSPWRRRCWRPRRTSNRNDTNQLYVLSVWYTVHVKYNLYVKYIVV